MRAPTSPIASLLASLVLLAFVSAPAFAQNSSQNGAQRAPDKGEQLSNKEQKNPRVEQRTERIHLEDQGSTVDELRIGGQTRSITVQPVAATRDALAAQGFGVLTEIDMKATLKAKLDQDMENYLILGACNPPLAHRAVSIDRQIGLLLPCNVVVRTDPADDARVLVEAMDPQLLVQVTGDPALHEVADEVAGKLRAAIETLGPASA